MPRYRSQIVQSLHYFSRPHEGVRREPLRGPSVWRGEELANDPSWREALSGEDIAEIEAAIAQAHATGRAVSELARDDFPLPGLSATIDRWRREIRHGRGFVWPRRKPEGRLETLRRVLKRTCELPHVRALESWGPMICPRRLEWHHACPTPGNPYSGV